MSVHPLITSQLFARHPADVMAAGLLMHFEGKDQSTSFFDQKFHAVSASGNAKLVGAQSKFGSTSFNVAAGGGDRAQITTDASIRFGTDDLTVDFWIRTNGAQSAFTSVMGNRTTGDTGWIIWVGAASANTLAVGTVNTQPFVESTNTIPASAWTHCAWTRTGGRNYVFINGVSGGSTTTGGAFNFSETGAIWIGQDPGFNSFDYNGNIAELRMIRGRAVWASDFTPPNRPYLG